jgi:CubicO group peptidase (beta-lactamase class C family)
MFAGMWSRADQRADLAAKIDPLFTQIEQSNWPGAAVLAARDGTVIFDKGYGFAQMESRVPMTTDTLFRIGSITKQFTSAAILKLAEEGKLSLDYHLSKFILDWPRGDEVTLRHLLTHSSGIHNYTAKPGFYDHVTEPISLADLVESFKNDPYDFNPGEKYSYCNSGYVLLGYIIEKVTGQSYESYLKKTFFDPMGMKHTSVYHAGMSPVAALLAIHTQMGRCSELSTGTCQRSRRQESFIRQRTIYIFGTKDSLAIASYQMRV